MHYYYLIASLPLLKFGQRSPFSLGEFLAQCRQSLTNTHFNELNQLLDGKFTGTANKQIRLWNKISISLRNSIAILRASRLEKPINLDIRMMEQTEQELYRSVARIFDQLNNPLARETALDQLRWELIDEVFSGEQFAITAVMAYGLKLQILKRWQSISTESGEERLGGILREAVSHYSD